MHPDQPTSPWSPPPQQPQPVPPGPPPANPWGVQTGQWAPPPQPDPPAFPGPATPAPGGRRPMVAILVGVAALVVVLGAGGTVAWVLTRHSGGPTAGASGAPTATWGVGFCIYLSKDFPHATPSVVSPEMQRIIEQSKEYQPVSCSD